MSHAATATKNETHAAAPKATAKAAAPRDAAAEQLQLLLMLAEDWLNGDRRHAGEIRALMVGLSPVTVPVNVDVPHVSQAGAVLSCTMGNWLGAPTSYSYLWQLDGANAGTDAPSYSVQAGDVGKSATCTVTATNQAGAAVAPISNAVTVA